MGRRTGSSTWWGKFSIQEGATAYWRVGPLEIWITRTAKEWRIGTCRDDSGADSILVVDDSGESSQPQPGERTEWQRFGFRQTTETVVLTPLLAPRPLVVKPETKFVLPEKEQTTLYISSPLWIQVELGRRCKQHIAQAVDDFDIDLFGKLGGQSG